MGWLEDIDVGGRGICQPAKGPLGRALRQVRRDLLLSQPQVARIAGVSQSTVSRVELGAPNWPVFSRIIDVLGGRPIVTVERLRTPRELTQALMAGDGNFDELRMPGEFRSDGWW